MKKNLLIVLFVVLALGVIAGGLMLLRGNEDTWICSNGAWVKHGNPSASMPTKPCDGVSRNCSQQAKLCPDGSVVGQVGPKCEFASCPGAVACTMEAKICPDGSSVGRQGPNCEFAPCSIISPDQFTPDALPGPSITSTGSVQISNPASVNCEEKGGRLVIHHRAGGGEDGGEFGVCYFDDNRACEEWAMFRGDCPVGGVKTTGYDTEAQRFCAWSGGSTFAVDNAVCIFKDGSQCPVLDFYIGICHGGSR
ncbi:MAG: DUF333 domain-containing protein [Candidatus Buchananbacteria bacterium]|jgi:hypothetical protein